MEMELIPSEMAATGTMPTHLDAVDMTLTTSKLLMNAAPVEVEKMTVKTVMASTHSETDANGMMRTHPAAVDMTPMTSSLLMNALLAELVMVENA